MDTGLLARSSSQEMEEQAIKMVEASLPLRRAATPQDVAHAAVYLASDAAAYVTGMVIDVNGGAYFA